MVKEVSAGKQCAAAAIPMSVTSAGFSFTSETPNSSPVSARISLSASTETGENRQFGPVANMTSYLYMKVRDINKKF